MIYCIPLNAPQVLAINPLREFTMSLQGYDEDNVHYYLEENPDKILQ